MSKYHKRNAKTGAKTHLQKSPLQYSPFSMQDTRYLEHLHQQLKLRNSQASMMALRKDMIEANNRANGQGELDLLMKELSRPNLPYSTKEHLNNKVKQMKNLSFT